MPERHRLRYVVKDANSQKIVAVGSAQQCAGILHMARSAFYTFAFQNRDAKCPKYIVEVEGVGKSPHHTRKKYNVYDCKKSKLLAEGTANECAKQLALTVHSFYSIVSRVKCGKNKKYFIDEYSD